jgi:predicted metal-dependent phosphoesterase TrpH
MKKLLRCDMHIHTKYSKDSRMEPREILRVAKQVGLDCIAITDHNTIRGGVETKRIRGDIKVIVGSEVKTKQGEVIGYNLNESIRSRDLFGAVDEIKSQGGLVSVPHPFDFVRCGVNDENVLDSLRGKIDFMEINARSFGPFNERSRAYAKKRRIPLVGGSDAHMPFEIGKCTTLVAFNKGFEPISVSIDSSFFHCCYTLGVTKIYKMLR